MMEAWQQVLAAYPALQTIWDGLCVCVPLAMLVAYAGIFFISATAKIMALARKRSAYDKCSRQIAMLGLILGWILVVGIRVWLYFAAKQGQLAENLNFIYEMSWLLLSLGVLLSSIYYTLWRLLKNMPVLHITLGMISGAQNCIALVVSLFAIRLSAALGHPDASISALPDLFPTAWNSPLWSACCYTVPLIFAMPGAFCAFWLVLRRRRDDFGRDYYNAMIPWCAGWALYPWCVLWLLLLVSTALQIWIGVSNANFSMDATIWDCARLLLWLLPIPLWIVIRKSSIPMRYKFINFLALAIAVSFILPYFMAITEI